MTILILRMNTSVVAWAVEMDIRFGEGVIIMSPVTVRISIRSLAPYRLANEVALIPGIYQPVVADDTQWIIVPIVNSRCVVDGHCSRFRLLIWTDV